MPSLRQLEYLAALSDIPHFRKAAKKVGVSQPTLSAQLRTLEHRLGVQLVERDRTHVIFTPVGKEVLARARRILRDVQEIRDLASRGRGDFEGIIRLGLPQTIGPYLLPRMVPTLHRRYPKLKLYVREEMAHDLPDALEEGHYDLLVMPLPVNRSDLASHPIFREPLFITVPTDHPLANKNSISRSDLRGESILSLGKGHQLHEQVEAICRDYGANLLIDFEGTSLDTLREMVGMGMGLSFLPGLYVRSNLKRDLAVKALELRGGSIQRTIGLVWRKSSSRVPEFEKLALHIRQTVKRDFPDFMLI